MSVILVDMIKLICAVRVGGNVDFKCCAVLQVVQKFFCSAILFPCIPFS